MSHRLTTAVLLLAACTQTETQYMTAEDSVPPHLLTVTPAPGTVASRASVVSAFFSEVMDRQRLVASFLLEGPEGVVAGDAGVSEDGQVLTFAPTALSLGAVYTASISDAATDVAGNHLATPVKWAFIAGDGSTPQATGGGSGAGIGGGTAGFGGGGGAGGGGTVPDTTPPKVASWSPGAEAPVEAAGTSSIVVTFDEPLDCTKLPPVPLAVVDSSNGLPVAGALYCAGGTLTFVPAPALPTDTQLTVSLSGQVRDLAGNPLGEPTSWQLTVLPWTRQLGAPGATTTASSAATDALGNLYVAGTTDGDLATDAGLGTSHAFVVKLTPAGAVAWVLQLGANEVDAVGSAIAADPAGNLYLAGTTSGALGDAPTKGTHDAFLAKLDTLGAVQWVRQLGASGVATQGSAVALDASGNPLVAGATAGALSSGNNAGGTDFFVAKYNSAGELSWVQQGGSNKNDRANAVGADASGNILLAGATMGVIPGASGGFWGESDLFVAKYDAAGTKKWVQTLGTWGDEMANGVAVDPTGGVLVTGATSGNLDGKKVVGTYDAFVTQYDAAGSRKDTVLFGTPQSDVGLAIRLDGSGNAVFAGTTSGNLFNGTVSGASDGFLGAISPTGTLRFGRLFGSNGGEQVTAMAMDPWGATFVVGSTTGTMGRAKVGVQDAFVAKFGPDGRAR